MVIPGNVILILSHKSACQEPKQPEQSGATVPARSSPHRVRPLPRTRSDDTASRPATLPAAFHFVVVRLLGVLEVKLFKSEGLRADHTNASAVLDHDMKRAQAACGSE